MARSPERSVLAPSVMPTWEENTYLLSELFDPHHETNKPLWEIDKSIGNPVIFARFLVIAGVSKVFLLV